MNSDSSVTFLFDYGANPSCSGTVCTSTDDESPTIMLPDVILVNYYGVSNEGVFWDNSYTNSWGFAANRTTQNMFQALLSAVRLDLGNVKPNNIFTNTTALDLTIIDGFIHSQTDIVLNNHTGQDGLARLPVIGSDAVFARSQFLCSVPRIKGTGSLWAALFVSTASVAMSLWGLFNAIAGYYAHRRPAGATLDNGQFSSSFKLRLVLHVSIDSRCLATRHFLSSSHRSSW